MLGFRPRLRSRSSLFDLIDKHDRHQLDSVGKEPLRWNPQWLEDIDDTPVLPVPPLLPPHPHRSIFERASSSDEMAPVG